jgi:hypothetical protein
MKQMSSVQFAQNSLKTISFQIPNNKQLHLF